MPEASTDLLLESTRHVRDLELLLGVEGLALLRHLYDGSDENAQQRLAEVRGLLEDEDLLRGAPIHEADPQAGYREWSASYDGPGNPMVALEQPIVWSLLEANAPGRALDAACGTGRHTKRLVELGHEVVGVDLTPEMLAWARSNVAGASFVLGDLRGIPAGDARFDVVVCALAVSHLGEPGGGISELSRVLRRGGQLVISVLHPTLASLGWQAPFAGPDGRRGFVREHPHRHGDYLRAFRDCGLSVVGCREPSLAAEHARDKRRAFGRVPDATIQAYVGLPAVLIWDLRKD
jgi:SAM-dependent methyltransferase